MNGFETVEKLKELEQKATPHTHYFEDICHTTVGSAESDLVLRNAAPLLLDIAGQIRPGDEKILGLFVDFMEKFNPSGHLNDEGPGKEITNRMAVECLKRYQNMAEKMNNWR